MLNYIGLALRMAYFMAGGMVGRLLVLQSGISAQPGPMGKYAVPVGTMTCGFLAGYIFQKIWAKLLQALHEQ